MHQHSVICQNHTFELWTWSTFILRMKNLQKTPFTHLLELKRTLLRYPHSLWTIGKLEKIPPRCPIWFSSKGPHYFKLELHARVFKQVSSPNPFVKNLIVLELGRLVGLSNELVQLPNLFMILYNLGRTKERPLRTFCGTILTFEREILSKGRCYFEEEVLRG